MRNVILKITLSLTAELTLGAVVWLFISVYLFYMNFKVTFSLTAVLTLGAAVWPFITMNLRHVLR